MDKDVLVEITVKRINGEIEYKVDCSKGITNEELSHYLNEIITGICTWKPGVCEGTIQSFVGKISVNNQEKLCSKCPLIYSLYHGIIKM